MGVMAVVNGVIKNEGFLGLYGGCAFAIDRGKGWTIDDRITVF